jgi:hypothetical protein
MAKKKINKDADLDKIIPGPSGEDIENVKAAWVSPEAMEAYHQQYLQDLKNTPINPMDDKYALGGITELPHLGFMPRSKGGSILAKGNKLAKHKPTKLY